MDNIILDIIATIGLTFIITKSKLFKPIRDFFSDQKMLGYLLRCPMCMGFWAGIIVYFIAYFKLDFIILGLVGSISSYVLYLVIKPLIDKYD